MAEFSNEVCVVALFSSTCWWWMTFLGEFCLTICENALFCLLYLFDGNSCKILTFCCGCCDLFSCLRFGRVTCLLLFLSCVHGLLRGKGAAKWNQLNENIHWGKSPTGEAIVSNQLSFFHIELFRLLSVANFCVLLVIKFIQFELVRLCCLAQKEKYQLSFA